MNQEINVNPPRDSNSFSNFHDHSANSSITKENSSEIKESMNVRNETNYSSATNSTTNKMNHSTSNNLESSINPVQKTKSRWRRAPDWCLMLLKFFRYGTSIASFVPSSSFLAKKIVDGIDFENAKCILELGAGTGPVTEELVKRAKPHNRLIIVELDNDFCNRLRQKFPNHEIIQGDAAQIDEILAKLGVVSVDHVVSGLPLPSINKKVRNGILDASHRVLTPNGTFRQLTNMPWVFHLFYRKYFKNVLFRFAIWNLPPAGVYICQGYTSRTNP